MSIQTTNGATMPVSAEFLCAILHLPEGTEIVGAEMDPGSHLVRLVVRHPDIPADARTVCPIFTSHVTAPVRFAGWQPE